MRLGYQNSFMLLTNVIVGTSLISSLVVGQDNSNVPSPANTAITSVGETTTTPDATATGTSDPCDALCANILSAVGGCPTSPASAFATCLCPTVLASGMACSSCIASVDADATDAAALSTIYTDCAALATAAAPTTSRVVTTTPAPATSATIEFIPTTTSTSPVTPGRESSSASLSSARWDLRQILLTLAATMFLGWFWTS